MQIPFVGTPEKRAACSAGETCASTQVPGEAPLGRNNFSDTQLDYYACLTELDMSVGKVLAALDRTGFRDNTMVWCKSHTHVAGMYECWGFAVRLTPFRVRVRIFAITSCHRQRPRRKLPTTRVLQARSLSAWVRIGWPSARPKGSMCDL